MSPTTPFQQRFHQACRALALAGGRCAQKFLRLRRERPLRAFTLIELLVVMAIIAILVALTFPMVNGMISRGRTAKCAANLKQIGVAFHQAVADRGMRIPDTITNDPQGGWEVWYGIVAPYLEIATNITDGNVWNGKRPPGVYACPASRGRIFNAASQATDYGYNIHLNERNAQGIARGDYLTKIAEPGKVLLLADTQRQSDPNRVGGRDIASYYISDLATRHGGKGNFLYLDGHVELQSRTNIPTNSSTYPWRPPPQ